MAGNTTDNSSALKQAQIYSTMLKDVLKEELMAMTYVETVPDFSTGDTLNIPTINDTAFVEDYTEDTPVTYQPMESGVFQFTFTEYKQSGHYITNKLKQDSYLASQLISKFVPAQARAIMTKVETDILNLSSKQTAADYNRINGMPHRFCAGGTNQVADLTDLQKASLSLKKANVPLSNKIAIVDPTYVYELQRLVSSNNISNNPRWEGIVATGGLTDTSFALNVDGWDIYVSNFLPTITETINGKTVTAGKANMFFSNTAGIKPFLFGWRQEPKVEGEYDMDNQRDKYITTARYGSALYRPENLVTILSATNQITY